MDYDLELEKTIKKIKEAKAKLVCIQLADGLKPESKTSKQEIEKNTKAKVIIWADTCFGACDTPIGLDKLGIDMIIQYGHSPWKA